MALIEDHNVVSTFAADRPDHLLDVAFCHGKRGAVTTSVIPIAATRLLKAEPYETSRSRSRKLGDQTGKRSSKSLWRSPTDFKRMAGYKVAVEHGKASKFRPWR